jgi:hypothetical protein
VARGVLAASRPLPGGVGTTGSWSGATLGLGSGREEPLQAHEVVRGAGEGDHPVDPRRPAMLQLPQPRHRLEPPENLLDLPSGALTRPVARVPRGAPVEGAAPGFRA